MISGFPSGDLGKPKKKAALRMRAERFEIGAARCPIGEMPRDNGETRCPNGETEGSNGETCRPLGDGPGNAGDAGGKYGWGDAVDDAAGLPHAGSGCGQTARPA